jgi:hypothetical protein
MHECRYERRELEQIHLGVGDEGAEYGVEMEEKMTRKKYIRSDMRGGDQ